jgi:hypothetical protein
MGLPITLSTILAKDLQVRHAEASVGIAQLEWTSQRGRGNDD